MTEATPRLALPYLQTGQAQKELTHNEALQRLDICVQSVVEAVLDAPPATPEAGKCWLVSATPSGEWSGNATSIAQWTAGGWRYVLPLDGFRVWVKSSATYLCHSGGNWSASLTVSDLRIGGQQVVGPQRAAISGPSGGSVIDLEGRACIAAIIATLQGHGLIAN